MCTYTRVYCRLPTYVHTYITIMLIHMLMYTMKAYRDEMKSCIVHRIGREMLKFLLELSGISNYADGSIGSLYFLKYRYVIT